MADRRRNNTKELIVVFTLDQIKENGYINLSQREISREFGIASTVFYHHFGGKENLLIEVLKLASQNLFDMYNEYRPEEVHNLNSVDTLVAYGRFILTMFKQQRNLMEFIFCSPTAFYLNTETNILENSSFPFMLEGFKLLDDVKKEYGLHIEQKSLRIKWASFFYGYLWLGVSSPMEYENVLIKDVISDIIAGDNAKKDDKFCTAPEKC